MRLAKNNPNAALRYLHAGAAPVRLNAAWYHDTLCTAKVRALFRSSINFEQSSAK
jgi:hypothetical protein